MNKILVAIITFWMASTAAHAASAVNLDAEPRTLVVTEEGDRNELALGAGETVEFCSNGCFVTLPNGDREVLSGTETIEISGGVARIR